MQDMPTTELGRIVITRQLTEVDDRVRIDECYGADGMPLSLTEALGMLRQAGDELLNAHYAGVLKQIRAMLLGDVKDLWDAERDAAIITLITETLDASPNAA